MWRQKTTCVVLHSFCASVFSVFGLCLVWQWNWRPIYLVLYRNNETNVKKNEFGTGFLVDFIEYCSNEKANRETDRQRWRCGLWHYTGNGNVVGNRALVTIDIWILLIETRESVRPRVGPKLFTTIFYDLKWRTENSSYYFSILNNNEKGDNLNEKVNAKCFYHDMIRDRILCLKYRRENYLIKRRELNKVAIHHSAWRPLPFGFGWWNFPFFD